MEAVQSKEPTQNNEQKKEQLPIKKVILDCTNCTNESLFDIQELKDFYLNRIKVKGQVNQLGKNISVNIDGNSIIIEYSKFICKRYMKFLGRKFLRAKKLNSWVRLVAFSKEGYRFAFYNIDKENEE